MTYTFDTLKQLDSSNIANTYPRNDVAFVSGNGSLLYDTEGKEYIDFTSGIGVNAMGICDVAWQEAVKEQLGKIAHISNLYYTIPQIELAKLMCEKTGMKKVFFGNSGAEANEGAIKCARKYSFDKYGPDRYEIITLVNSFHGRTMATLSATGQDHFHEFFMPFLDGFQYAQPNDTEDLKKKITAKTCAVMIETIQGEGGVQPLDRKYVEEVAAICKEKDILLIVDEVQTGNGRTGWLYSYMAFGITPDIVSTAKGLAGGLPFGAVLMGEKCKDTLNSGSHGSTFGGNPVVAAGALNVFSRLDEAFLAEIKEKEKMIDKFLGKCENIESITGMGLMKGIALKNKDAKEVLKECLKNGLLILTAKEKLRLLPPLNIENSLLEKGLSILKEVIEK
ncbi:MAG: aspartate aminotransferase family protein [Fusobacteriaceae bacterium]|jgi:acetylornithine/N-succinyldiaminopimelate aminotransferase|nr:aspartate aminotransferase family protein [Fusobacteriaceae bacterium]